jgi:hypothetical protein
MKYKYIVLDYDLHDITNAEIFKSTWNINLAKNDYYEDCYLRWIAEDAADDFFNSRDGFDYAWPIKIKIWDLDDNLLGIFKILIDEVPKFEAEIIKS